MEETVAKVYLKHLYREIGEEGCFELAERFYRRVADDPILRPLFQKDFRTETAHLAMFLMEQTGGPQTYTAKRGKQSLLCRHAHLRIGPTEVTAWLTQMCAALDETGIKEPARSVLHAYFEETANGLSDPLIEYYDPPPEQLRLLLDADPSLAARCEHGKTLLLDAVSRWDLARTQLLFEYGADVHTLNHGGHDALYCATNALFPEREEEGKAIVRLLLEQGADVNRQTGVVKVTALHVAARRGSVRIARVLLDAGARTDIRDAKGDTPLQRARNCRQHQMIELLHEHSDALHLQHRTVGEPDSTGL